MKVMKLALLGTAALAAASLSANANDLSDLKAQIEALNSRIATLEAAPSVPAGFSLMTMSKAPRILAPGEELEADELAMVNTIGILPTADVPASTNIQWSGNVKAAFVYRSFEKDFVQLNLPAGTVFDSTSLSDSSTHILANTEINMTATTDTAVGEVGVFARWGASADGHTNTQAGIKRYYGWWKMTPELSLKAGFKDSIGGVGHGSDKCSCNFNSYVGILGGMDDSAQFELRYASGPIEAAIAIEHHGHGVTPDDQYVVAGEVKWTGDSVSVEVAGFAGDHTTSFSHDVGGTPATIDAEHEIWQIGVGATATLDMFTISANVGVGQGASTDAFFVSTGDNAYGWIAEHDYLKASLFMSAALSDSISAELGVGYHRFSNGDGVLIDSFDNPFLVGVDGDTVGVAGGLYWSPVDKLTIGAEASWVSTSYDLSDAVGIPNYSIGVDREDFTAALVTVFKF